ncbi:MAG: hypothetical protein RSE41_04955 [Clostridia bacterium]
MTDLEYINKETGQNYENLDQINWSNLSYDYKLSEEFIRHFKDKVYWPYISYKQNLSESFIEEFEDKIEFESISVLYNKFSLEFIRKYKNKISWDYLSYAVNLPYSFIKEFSDLLDWKEVSTNTVLSEDIMRAYSDKIHWPRICKYQHLYEGFIREFKRKVHWDDISYNQKLSENFIREFKDEVNWEIISEKQCLSEDFIREFKDRVYWYNIVNHQKLSENFIREFKDTFNHSKWKLIATKQKLSEFFIIEFKNKFKGDDEVLYYQKLSSDTFYDFCVYTSQIKKIPQEIWLYKDTEFKKQQILNTKLYECYDSYFIAYKGIRSDRYSRYNLHYQYLKGGIYEAHADHTDAENSFGLSVWTEREATKYCNELVVRCKIYYKDVARIMENNGKIRCTKIEILD